MNDSNIRIVNQPLDPALGWTTVNQGPNSIQIPGHSSSNVSWGGQVFPQTSTPQNQGNQSMMPTTPPPSFTPQKKQSKVSTYAIDSGSISGCLYRWVYIWPSYSQQGFWLFLTYVGPRSIAGFRMGRFGFSYYGIDVNRIDSFECY